MPVEKTVIIYDQCGESPLSFVVLKGDYTHLDGVFINSTGDTEKQDQLAKLLYGDEGQTLYKMRKKFPTKAVREGAKVIICGLIP